jgi:RHS repeat-associated protein
VPPPRRLYSKPPGHVDHLNTPRLVSDSTGTAIWKWDQQEPFGSNPADQNPSGLGTFDLPLRLPGQTYDLETGLHYNYFRDFDPSLGIYKQSDPIGLEGGLNTYAYVRANPIAMTDPFGLMGSGGGGAVTYPPKQPQVECPCPDPITITTTSSVCQPGDELCAQAMQAAGIQGPYFGGTKTYSLPCLIKFGIGVSGGKFAVGTVAINQAPKVAAQMGLSAANVAKVAKAAAVMNSPPAMLIGGTVTIATILKQCECPTQ